MLNSDKFSRSTQLVCGLIFLECKTVIRLTVSWGISVLYYSHIKYDKNTTVEVLLAK